MIKTILLAICIIANILENRTQDSNEPIVVVNNRYLYEEMELGDKVGFEVFEEAIEGYYRYRPQQPGILTLIDFSKPSTEERFYVLDLEAKKLLYATYVAHGRNSGGNFAKSFSNIPGSFQSSTGFFTTGSTYIGKNGYSLFLDGLEKGVNDRARERAIVIHGAAYANPSIIASQGRLGRSLGCPALPPALNRPIIDAIKGGSLLYIHGNVDV